MSVQGAKQRSHQTPVEVVEQLVQEEKTEIGHAYLIDIGVAEGKPYVDLPRLFYDAVRLGPYVPSCPRYGARYSNILSYSPYYTCIIISQADASSLI